MVHGTFEGCEQTLWLLEGGAGPRPQQASEPAMRCSPCNGSGPNPWRMLSAWAGVCDVTRFAFPVTALGRLMGSVGRAENTRRPVWMLLQQFRWETWVKVSVVDLERCWCIRNRYRVLDWLDLAMDYIWKVWRGWCLDDSDLWLA